MNTRMIRISKHAITLNVHPNYRSCYNSKTIVPKLDKTFVVNGLPVEIPTENGPHLTATAS